MKAFKTMTSKYISDVAHDFYLELNSILLLKNM